MQSASSLYSTRLCASLLLPIPPSTKFETMLPHSLSLSFSLSLSLFLSLSFFQLYFTRLCTLLPPQPNLKLCSLSLSFSHAFSFSLPLSLYTSLLYPTLLN